MTGALSSIQISKQTRDLLSKLGAHRESYEDIILRLIESYNNKPNQEIPTTNKEEVKSKWKKADSHIKSAAKILKETRDSKD